LEYEKYKDYDYLGHKYKNLTDDYKIIISNADFQKTMDKYSIYPDRIRTFKDSLGVVMLDEFGNETQARIAKLKVGYTYLRVGYHIWLTEEETKELNNRYSFTHPYELRKFIGDASRWDDYMKSFMKDLRNELYKVTEKKEIFELDTEPFLSIALRYSPTRIKDYQARVSKSKNTCTIENCCQGDANTADKSKCEISVTKIDHNSIEESN
jgi:hypothetical protein